MVNRSIRGNWDNFSCTTVVAAVMGTKHCERGGNGDDFLSPCNSLVSSSLSPHLPWYLLFHLLIFPGIFFFISSSSLVSSSSSPHLPWYLLFHLLIFPGIFFFISSSSLVSSSSSSHLPWYLLFHLLIFPGIFFFIFSSSLVSSFSSSQLVTSSSSSLSSSCSNC